MTTDTIGPDPVPIACTLSGEDLRSRELVWRELMEHALLDRDAIPEGVRLRFDADHGTVHRLVDLVAAERTCCGWASWTLIATEEATTVEVTGEGHHAEAARQMFGVG
ncbi:MAG: hypothetical protein M3349_07305 [Actinomycetota bacterium]|nr:hypothetical protein [Actinomycetota bacterium]